jgi:hypothetical protein
VGVNVTRVHPLAQNVDGLALARAIDAADDEDDGVLLPLDELELRVEQGLSKRRRLLGEGALVDLVA